MCADAINKGSYEDLPGFMHLHLEQCDQCANEVTMVTEISAGLPTSKIPHSVEEDENPGNRYMRPWYMAAFLAAAAVILFTIIRLTDSTPKENFEQRYIQSQTNAPERISKQQDSLYPQPVEKSLLTEDATTDEQHDAPYKPDTIEVTPQEHSQNLLARYTPHAELEQLYANMQQAYRSQQISVFTPDVINRTDHDSIRWANPEKQLLFVEFFNNSGEEVQSISITSEAMAIPDLPDGLYYWKLINEEYDLLFVGKVIID